MASFKKKLAKIPLVGPVLVFGYRFRMAMGYYTGPLAQLGKWMFTSREAHNYTYELDPANRDYLIAFVAQVTDRPHAEISGYVAEVENDHELRRHVVDVTRQNGGAIYADAEARYGRRLGWYAFVRASKPKVVIETGVDKGLGAVVLATALLRNRDEGHEGYYYGTDINPKAGYLLCGKYGQVGKMLYGDSIESLKALNPKIDLFVNDSDHSDEYEAAEYQTIEKMLTPNAIILGDNAHCTDKLLQFALKTGRAFLYFQEKPRDHWYPGAGIGAAFTRNGNA